MPTGRAQTRSEPFGRWLGAEPPSCRPVSDAPRLPIPPSLEWRNPMTRILFVGQKPETVDFSDPSLPPGFDADKINAGIALGVAKIKDRGWQGDTCMITPDAAGSAMLKEALKGAVYDCVVIGGGI